MIAGFDFPAYYEIGDRCYWLWWDVPRSIVVPLKSDALTVRGWRAKV